MLILKDIDMSLKFLKIWLMGTRNLKTLNSQASVKDFRDFILNGLKLRSKSLKSLKKI